MTLDPTCLISFKKSEKALIGAEIIVRLYLELRAKKDVVTAQRLENALHNAKYHEMQAVREAAQHFFDALESWIV